MCRAFLILLIGCMLNITADEIGSSVSTLEKNSTKVGKISEAKCWEYGESVYRLSNPPTFGTERKILNESTCSIVESVLTPGVKDAKEDEFPHMALLGSGEKGSTRKWMCLGSLISNQFVLTAAHCTFSRNHGTVNSIRLGAMHFDGNPDAPHADFSVIETIRHPSYRPPSRYNDIALLKMDRPTEFNKHIRPACLQTSFEIPNSKYITTGWCSINEYCQNCNDILKKVILETFAHDQCNTVFQGAHFKNRITPESQICAGGLGSDDFLCQPCQGSSGGPLQIYHPKVHCMYSIVGVVSYGNHCRTREGIIDVNTRVSNYIEWIEKIVWPKG